MVEAKKCVRCGCMYIAETEVCGKCQKRDGADMYKLRDFLNEGYEEEITQTELSVATGISNKNLSRFLGYDEFKGICIEEKNIKASNKDEEIGEVIGVL